MRANRLPGEHTISREFRYAALAGTACFILASACGSAQAFSVKPVRVLPVGGSDPPLRLLSPKLAKR
jgi:hypothetical protein